MRIKLIKTLPALLFLIFFITCEKEKPQGLYDPDYASNPVPVITSIDPPESALAGIVEITISGNNFSPRVDENLVYFNKTRADVLEASPTQLVVQSPNLVSDSIMIKVAVQGSVHFSELMPYKLIEGVGIHGELTDFDEPYGIACDRDENLYVSLAGKKIIRIAPDGTQEDYTTTLVDKASAMKMGPGGTIYYVNVLKYMFRIPPGGGTNEFFATLPGGVYDLDFDANGNIFCGGGGNAIYCVKSDGSSQTVADYASIYIRAVRVFNDFIYVAGEYLGADVNQVKEGVWRNKILNPAGELDSNELVFDWGKHFDATQYHIASMTFAADGDLYVGTNAPEVIIVVHPDASYESLYPGVLEPETYALCWGTKEYLYVNRRGDEPGKKRIIRINMLKAGAPYYGRQ